MKSATAKTHSNRNRRQAGVTAPPEQHAELVKLSELLSQLLVAPNHDLRQFILVGTPDRRISLPESAVRALQRSVEMLSKGYAVNIFPVRETLTTQKAADILNVSRQYLVRLLDEGKIPHTKVGKHRRIQSDDLLAFKEKRDKRREVLLAEISRLGQEMGGYYDPPLSRELP